jgi:hypothetical protein
MSELWNTLAEVVLSFPQVFRSVERSVVRCGSPEHGPWLGSVTHTSICQGDSEPLTQWVECPSCAHAPGVYMQVGQYLWQWEGEKLDCTCEIWSSQGGDYKGLCLLGCNTVYFCNNISKKTAASVYNFLGTVNFVSLGPTQPPICGYWWLFLVG